MNARDLAQEWLERMASEDRVETHYAECERDHDHIRCALAIIAKELLTETPKSQETAEMAARARDWLLARQMGLPECIERLEAIDNPAVNTARKAETVTRMRDEMGILEYLVSLLEVTASDA